MFAYNLQLGPKSNKPACKKLHYVLPQSICIFIVIAFQRFFAIRGVLNGVGGATHLFLDQNLAHLGRGKFAGGQHIGNMGFLHPLKPFIINGCLDIYGNVVYVHVFLVLSEECRVQS